MVDTGILPVINTGIAHKEAGVGQIGAGVTRAPARVLLAGGAALSAEVRRRKGARARLAVLAIGGNALIRDRKHESIPDQYEMVCSIATTSAACSRAAGRWW